jgi:hypothetical protein
MGARARLFVLSFVGMACVWLGGATGCGSVIYVNQVTRKASTSVEAAKAAEADVYAPYHYTLAVHYLRKSREEAAAADFQAANRFGRMSYKAAEIARELAVERAANPRDTSWKPPPGTAGHDGTAPAPASDGDESGGEDGEAPSGDATQPADAAGDGNAVEGEAPPAVPDTAKDADAAKAGDADAAEPKPRAGRKAKPKAAKPEVKPDATPDTSTGAKEDGQ